jgi:hypothetical protein
MKKNKLKNNTTKAEELQRQNTRQGTYGAEKKKMMMRNKLKKKKMK